LIPNRDASLDPFLGRCAIVAQALSFADKPIMPTRIGVIAEALEDGVE
jgi:hypothetical protein